MLPLVNAQFGKTRTPELEGVRTRPSPRAGASTKPVKRSSNRFTRWARCCGASQARASIESASSSCLMWTASPASAKGSTLTSRGLNRPRASFC